MVLFSLVIKADLQGVTNLQPLGGLNDPDFTYLFKLKCEGCGELTKKDVAVRFSLSKRKGATDLVRKCKFCEREGSVTMMPEFGRPLTKRGAYVMAFDCKGYEPVDYVFGGGWKVQSVTGETYDNVDLSEGEFAEYDERGELLVRISSLHASFNVMRLK